MDYFWHPLSETPFSLGIALPQDYGRYRVNGKIEVALAKANCEYMFLLFRADFRSLKKDRDCKGRKLNIFNIKPRWIKVL